MYSNLIKNKTKSTAGSVIVDASICIGIFLLAICSILTFILKAGTEAKDFHKLAEESQGITSIYAAEGIFFSDSIFSVNDGIMFLSSDMHTIAFRPFLGTKDNSKDRLVYIFPKRGIRYHIAGCKTLNAGDIETVLNREIREKYFPCKICKPETLPDGALVYLYTVASDVYHRQNCATITKSYEKIGVSEAEKRGYSPCKLCLPDLNKNSDESEN